MVSINDISDALFNHLNSQHKVPLEKLKVMINQYADIIKEKANKINELETDYVEKYESKRVMQNQMYEEFVAERKQLYDKWLATGSRQALYDMNDMKFDYQEIPDIYARADVLRKPPQPKVKPGKPAKKPVKKPEPKKEIKKPEPKEDEPEEEPEDEPEEEPEDELEEEPKPVEKPKDKPKEPVKAKAKGPSGPQGCGITNLGNSCYINSTLQYLLHLPMFNTILLDYADSNNAVIKAYLDLYAAYMKKDVPRKNVQALVDKLNDTLNEGDKFDVTEQLDASEFMLKLLEKMNITELSNLFTVNIQTKKDFHQTIKKGKKELKCEEQKDVSNIPESSVIINFSDKKAVYNIGTELTKAYDGITEEVSKKSEFLDCNKAVDVATDKVQPKSEKFPYTRTDKVTTYPLCLRVLCNIFDNKLKKTFIKTEIPNEWEYDGRKYKLNGIIVHFGASMSSGHYEYYSAEDQWYEYSDSSVKPYKATKPKAAYYKLSLEENNVFYPNKALPCPYIVSYTLV
jgi:ubiquitin C-terminal hydrolase